MSSARWREPMAGELAIAHAWVQRWNDYTGDSAALSDDVVVRSSCDCGRCASFAAWPVPVAARPGTSGALPIQAILTDESGAAVGGVLVSTRRPGSLEFDVYPLGDRDLPSEPSAGSLRFDMPDWPY